MPVTVLNIPNEYYQLYLNVLQNGIMKSKDIQYPLIQEFRKAHKIQDNIKMIVSTLEIFTNFHILCEASFAEKGGLIVWIDYYNFFVNQNDDISKNSSKLFNPLKSNVNFESSTDNLCLKDSTLYYRHFFY